MIRAFKAWFSERKLWQKLLILYLTVSIIPIVALRTLSYMVSADIMYDQVSVRLYESTRNMAGQIRAKKLLLETSLDEVAYQDAFLQRLALAPRSTLFRKELEGTCGDLLRQLQKVAGEVTNVCILLPGRDTVISALEGDYTALEREAGKVCYTADSLVALTSSQETTCLYRQIVNPYSGGVIGTIVLQLDSRRLFGELHIEGLKEYAFIMQDGDGVNLYTEARLNKSYGEIFPHTLRFSDSREIKLMRHTFLYEPYYMADLNWNVCLLIPKDILFAGFSDIILFSLSIALVCILLVSVFSILISLSFSRRLNGISQEMIRVGTGKLEVNLDVKENGDEIGHLAYIFNEMVNRLNTLIIDKYKSELKQQEAQLKILQAQINPHFLYNCMDTINWRAIMNGDEKTSAFATNLSDFYRTCLNKGNTKIRMKDEFKNIRAYLQLQEDLHDYSFDVFYDVDERIYDYESVNLILQPVVENALEHGVEKTTGVKGAIRISAAFEEENGETCIVIRVFNTGPPIDPRTAEEVLTDPSRGYGLANVHSRIQLYFGKTYGVHIAPAQGGTLCRIVIPAIRWKQYEEQP